MKKEIKFILAPLVIILVVAGWFLFANKNESTPEVTSPMPTSGLNPVRDTAYTKGPSDARVTVVEFFDPECEGCAAFHPLLKKILEEHPNDVKLVARYMLYHGNSQSAALALEGAGAQGKYWEMYNFMLERQNEWSHQQGSVTNIFEKYARELNLNIELFNQSYTNQLYMNTLARDVAEGQQLGVKGTPTFFINGKMLMSLSYQSLKDAIMSELQ